MEFGKHLAKEKYPTTADRCPPMEGRSTQRLVSYIAHPTLYCHQIIIDRSINHRPASFSPFTPIIINPALYRIIYKRNRVLIARLDLNFCGVCFGVYSSGSFPESGPIQGPFSYLYGKRFARDWLCGSFKERGAPVPSIPPLLSSFLCFGLLLYFDRYIHFEYPGLRFQSISCAVLPAPLYTFHPIPLLA